MKLTKKQVIQHHALNGLVTGIQKAFGIQDRTDENIITPISTREQAIQDQKALWEREDQIRKETQLREDSAYQRAVEDARKAGINVNLTGVNPAGSGGGITTATPQDYTMQNAEYSRETERIIQIIQQEFEMSENAKDRIIDVIKGGLMAGAILLK